MPEYAFPTAKRGRGRPRGGSSGARERILAAAVDEFGAAGYDAATIRGIAARAGVDPALVHHYFGADGANAKAELFAEAVGAPMRPDVELPQLLAGPRAEIGERIVRYILREWSKPDVRKRGTVLMRAGIGNRLSTPLLSGFLARELIGRIATAIETPDAELRASLVASQIAGLIVTRYILRLPALVAATDDEIVALVAPNVQRYLTG